MSRFKDYVTSRAFVIDLSTAQVKALNSLIVADNSMISLRLVADSRTFRALHHKGLVDFTKDRKIILSTAGKLVIKLLEQADLLHAYDGQLFSKTQIKKIEREAREEKAKP